MKVGGCGIPARLGKAPLLLDHSAIELPDYTPAAVRPAARRIVSERVLGGQFLVHLDPPAGRLSGIEITVLGVQSE
jgi:hypothetical protein